MPDAGAQFPELEEWIASGIARGDTHMLVVYDEIDHNHFASYVRSGESVEQAIEEHRENNCYLVLEVFDLREELAPQLADYRARYYGG